MTALFTVNFEVHMMHHDETFACTSEPMMQKYVPEFIQKITEAGHTLVKVCRVEEEPEDLEEEVVVEDIDDPFENNPDIVVEEDFD